MERWFPYSQDMLPEMKLAYFHCDARLTEEKCYMAGEETPMIPEGLARRIQRVCFDNLGYVPMVTYNKRFESEATVTFRPLVTPDVSMEDILSRKIQGYREKKDGSLVSAAICTWGEHSSPMWSGGISSPAYLEVKYFELVGTTAYAIQPFNIESEVICGEVQISFCRRDVFTSVPEQWSEGAIALVLGGGGIQEKRIKRTPTAEVQVRNNLAWIDGKSYPIEDDGTGEPYPDGIWECAYVDGKVYAISQRPWKSVTRDFFRKMRVPTVQNLPPIFAHQVEVRGDSLYRTVSSLVVPVSQIVSMVFADPVVTVGKFNLEAVLAQKPPVRTQVLVYQDEAERGWKLVGTESEFAGRPPFQGASNLFVSVPYTHAHNIRTPVGNLYLRPVVKSPVYVRDGLSRYILAIRSAATEVSVYLPLAKLKEVPGHWNKDGQWNFWIRQRRFGPHTEGSTEVRSSMSWEELLLMHGRAAPAVVMADVKEEDSRGMEFRRRSKRRLST